MAAKNATKTQTQTTPQKDSATTARKGLRRDVDDNVRVRLPVHTLYMELRCPICLEVLCDTRCVKECLHRFCRLCLEQALRKNGKECPICRTPMMSRRDAVPDTALDTMIASLDLQRESEKVCESMNE